MGLGHSVHMPRFEGKGLRGRGREKNLPAAGFAPPQCPQLPAEGARLPYA